MHRRLLGFSAVGLLLGCTRIRTDQVPTIDSWDSCVFERMSLRNYEKHHDAMRMRVEAFCAVLRKIKEEPGTLGRYIAYWEKRAELMGDSPDEFPHKSSWEEFKRCSVMRGAQVLAYSGRRGDYTEDGMVVVRDGEVLCRHKIRWGTTTRTPTPEGEISH